MQLFPFMFHPSFSVDKIGTAREDLRTVADNFNYMATVIMT